MLPPPESRLGGPRLAPADQDAAVTLARAVLAEIFGPAPARTFAVRLWEGTTEGPSEAQARFVLVLHHAGALRRMLLPPTELSLGEAYVRGDFEIEGDIEAAAALAGSVARYVRSVPRALRLALQLRALPAEDTRGGRARERERYRGSGARHSRRRDTRSVRYHYDLGNDFFSLWLDRRMVYSCGYFPTGTEDLDGGQAAKLDLICRKLRLRAGERLLDIGCGWGGLVIHAAEHYGVQALGITVSGAQAAFARQRIEEAGIADRCRVELRDYRDIPAAERFDKISSIGMVEHVGRARLRTYFEHAWRLLRPGGLFLNHGIVSLESQRGPLRRLAALRLRRWTSFIERYVFPDGELVPLTAVLAPAEDVGFEVRDVENLREHYVETLRHWVCRLEHARAQAVALVGEEPYRVWRLYMAGSAEAFASGRIGVIQTLLARPDQGRVTGLPRTRADLYVP